MKISIVLPLVISVVCANTGCKKPIIDFGSVDPNIPIIPTAGNTAPVAYAGEDIFVLMPLNYAKLNGSASDNENNISGVNWAKIGGPDSYTFENQSSFDTKVNDLKEGVYEFELTVTDNMNLSDKDTLVVRVGENLNEIIFNDLLWISPWYYNVEIKNFVSKIPPGGVFKVFIQRDNDPAWIEVPAENGSVSGNGLYDYFIITNPNGMYNEGSLYISYYGSDIDDTPNVKIIL